MKKIFLVMFSILISLSYKNIYAKQETLVMDFQTTPYYLRQGEGGVTTGKLSFYYLNGDVAYCIEPGVQITDNLYVTLSPDNANLPNDVLNKIKLIGYYGYEYPNHQTDRYRMATQALIWETVRNLSVLYSTEKNGMGTVVDVSSEKNEIMNLVNNHYTLPSFNSDFTFSFSDDNILVDTNNVLSDFEIINNNSSLEASIDNNTLHLKSDTIGDYSITLRKKKYDNKETLLYVGSDGMSQKLMKLRYSDEVELNLNIHIVGGKLFLKKLDNETKCNQSIGNSLLKNAKYGIYDMNDNLVDELITNNLGESISNYLKLGKYYLKELEAGYGYLLDDNKYEFIIDKNNLNKELEVYEDLIKKDVKIIKTLESEYTLLDTESNIIFQVYFKDSNILYDTITTDKNGVASIKLPYGIYIFHQVNTSNGYLKSEDFEVEINENTTNIYKIINDKRVRGSLKIIKSDLNNNLLKDAFFEIYKDNDLIYSGYTDEFGLIELNDLFVGEYLIIEKEAPKGYELDNIEYNVNITNDNADIVLEIKNKAIEIEVPKTDKNANIKLKYSSIGLLLLSMFFIIKSQNRRSKNNYF